MVEFRRCSVLERIESWTHSVDVAEVRSDLSGRLGDPDRSARWGVRELGFGHEKGSHGEPAIVSLRRHKGMADHDLLSGTTRATGDDPLRRLVVLAEQDVTAAERRRSLLGHQHSAARRRDGGSGRLLGPKATLVVGEQSVDDTSNGGPGCRVGRDRHPLRLSTMLPAGSRRNAVSPSLFQIAEPEAHQ